MKTPAVYTTWTDKTKKALTCMLKFIDLDDDLGSGEILVRMLYVPIHGSFWLASDPRNIHPRSDEFMSDDGFVFGNGGVGEIVRLGAGAEGNIGDVVCVFGHIPCDHLDCYACRVMHRYTECDYDEGKIIGHGKNGKPGTFAEHVVLPRYSYEVLSSTKKELTEDNLIGSSFAFLLADVRNALTRNPDVLKSRNMMIFGAGFSGVLAAYLFLNSSPESKVFVIDSSQKNLDRFNRIFGSTQALTVKLDAKVNSLINLSGTGVDSRGYLAEVIEQISGAAKSFFNNGRVEVMFDASSGNTSMLWDNSKILKAGTIVIPFGFGNEYILLSKSLIQKSGLTIQMSRGVGNIRNRQEAVRLIRDGAGEFIYKSIIRDSEEINGIEKAVKYVNDAHSQDEFQVASLSAYIKI